MTRMQSGYTLVEVIVATTILSLMVAVVVGTYSLGRRPETLISETERLAGALRNTRLRAFNHAVFYSGSNFCSLSPGTSCSVNDDCVGLGHCTNAVYPPYGYGVHVSNSGGSSVYSLFANMTDEGTPPYYAGSVELIESVSLPDYLTIFRDNNNANDFEVIFKDTGLEIYQDVGGVWGSATASTTLTIQDINSCASIGRKGLIMIHGTSEKIDSNILIC